MLTQERVRELFDYDPETGELIHKITKGRSKKGAVAGLINDKGYRVLGADGGIYRAHRIVWLHHTGSFPGSQIDHINGCRSDNRIDNLRDVTNTENHKNMKRQARNRSGVTGVCFCRKINKWRAYISINKPLNLGAFFDKEDAIHARRKAEIKYGYHVNHGRSS